MLHACLVYILLLIVDFFDGMFLYELSNTQVFLEKAKVHKSHMMGLFIKKDSYTVLVY